MMWTMRSWQAYAFIEIIQILGIFAAPTEPVLSAASFYVPRLPDLHEDPARPLHIYAGHIPSDPKRSQLSSTEISAHLFFLLLKARRTADRERVIFWFNGGPGCSSFDGAMLESGPFRVDGKGGLMRIDGGWEEYATVIFVDQPAGTGLSYTSTNRYVHELTEGAEQFMEFLRNFYDIFPEYRAMDTYLAGESYAGQTIPYIADYILNSNLNLPLRGVAIGNGWIDGRTQYPSYVPFSLKMNLFKENSKEHLTTVEATEKCMHDINETYGTSGPLPPSISICDKILSGLLKTLSQDVRGNTTCINMYDVRLTDTYPSCGMNWPPGLPEIGIYLHRRDVVDALHATAKSESWTECSGRVNQEMHNKMSNASIELFPKLLQKMKVLLFAGDKDLICNHLGMERMVGALKWNEEVGLGDAKTQGWSVNNTDAGTWVEARNLTYVKIFNASHMAPFDFPHVTHDMMLRFMGVDFSAIAEGSAKIPSNVGVEFKPSFRPVVDEKQPQSGTTVPGIVKTPEQDKAMWEAYYNAGSGALVLVLIALAIGLFFWFRARRRRSHVQLSSGNAEEIIPLRENRASSPNGHYPDDDEDFRRRKGKGRAEPPTEAIFDVGDSDGEDEQIHRQ